MGISLTEFTVIFLVALVLFGPEQLPVLARTLGKLTGQVKKTSDSLRREFYNSAYPPAQELRNSIDTEVRALRTLKAEVLAPPPGAVGTSSHPAKSIQTAPRSTDLDSSRSQGEPSVTPSEQSNTKPA